MPRSRKRHHLRREARGQWNRAVDWPDELSTKLP